MSVLGDETSDFATSSEAGKSEVAVSPAPSRRCEIYIEGVPRPKERPRLRAGGGFTPPATRGWEEVVTWAAISQGARRVFSSWDGEYAVDVTIYHAKVLRGDLDNYLKAILDGLQTAGVLRNDKLVRELTIRRVPDDVDGTAIVVRGSRPA